MEAMPKFVNIVGGGSIKHPSSTRISSPARREEPNSTSIEPSSTWPSNQQAEKLAGTARVPVNKSAGVNKPEKWDGGRQHNPYPLVKLIGPANKG